MTLAELKIGQDAVLRSIGGQGELLSLIHISGSAVHITIIAPSRAQRRTAQLRLSGHQAMKSGRPKKLPKQCENTNAGTGCAPVLR